MNREVEGGGEEAKSIDNIVDKEEGRRRQRGESGGRGEASRVVKGVDVGWRVT